MKRLDDNPALPVIPTSDSTDGRVSGIDSRYMTAGDVTGANAHRSPNPIRAALYARVSSELQQKERTIESQIEELKKQIAVAGHELVKEYIDDGHSGAYLDRPALDELRAALKTDAFHAVYFLCADRIARDVVHQNIIVSELLKYKKQIIIGGKDYEENPENKFGLTVLGAVAEFERAKIAERMRRGRLHHLRTGELSSHGYLTYGYDYLKKSLTSPAVLVVNEEQAKIVRWMFEAYASGWPIVQIARSLDERGVPTSRRAPSWSPEHVRLMLKNPTYTGVRYFNRLTSEKSPTGQLRRIKTPKRVIRDRQEWIAVGVPAIISRELFDKAQERARLSAVRRHKPVVTHLLSGLVRCAECGRLYRTGTSTYNRVLRPGTGEGPRRGYYVCYRTGSSGERYPGGDFKRCRNPRVETHILDQAVVGMIRDIMLDPGKLERCVETGEYAADPAGAREFGRIAGEINGVEEKRRHLIQLYTTERMTSEEYIKASQELDEAVVRLKGQKAELAKAIRNSGQQAIVGASIRRFCASARARFETCATFEAKRQFLRDNVERIVFDNRKITIIGSVSVQRGSVKEANVPFRIEGEIDQGAARRNAMRKAWPEDERVSSWVPVAVQNDPV